MRTAKIGPDLGLRSSYNRNCLFIFVRFNESLLYSREIFSIFAYHESKQRTTRHFNTAMPGYTKKKKKVNHFIKGIA